MPLHKGDILGAYEIVGPLGQGGMATVYKAFHPRLNRFVAIKMIHPAYLQDPNYLTRFEREAQIVAALEHLYIVPVYDFSEHNGEPYLVMKLIEGNTLKALLAERELPVEDILEIITPIASALDYAHSRGVLHRDVKPSNIIIDKQGTPYLSDFGLARLTVSGASTLSQDMMIGTPYYISPEQARGNVEIDARSDLYSFGVVLYELFVGRVPFSEGTPYSIISDHIARELPRPSALNPTIPPAIELVLMKSLSKLPDDRYQSAGEMVAAMRSAVKTRAPELATLNIGRQSVVVASATRHTAPAITRESKKTEPLPPKKPAPAPVAKSSSRGLVIVLLTVVLIALLVVLVVLAFHKTPQTTAVVTQQPTILITLPRAPTEIPATATLQPVTIATRPSLSSHPTPGENPSQMPDGNPPTVPPFDVPEMSAQQARNMINRNPSNPTGYLALARTQLQSNSDADAFNTLQNGLSHVSDRIRFEMTAAEIAVQIARYDAAFEIYAGVLQDAQNQPPYPAVRTAAGEYLYEAATLVGRLNLNQTRTLAAELVTNTSPIVSAMIGRAFLASDMPRLAETSIKTALKTDSTLAEAHLVNGEYQLAQGDKDTARSEWELALNDQTAPQWVHDRANQLINTNQ